MRTPRVWIYARVSEPSQRDLIFYQKDLLYGFAEYMNLSIRGFTQEITNGTNFETRGIDDLLVHIRREDFDVLLIYDWTRLTIHLDRYMEIKMFCDQHHIAILTMQDIESRVFLDD